jgi:probable HAF family extracellular repeat protein
MKCTRLPLFMLLLLAFLSGLPSAVGQEASAASRKQVPHYKLVDVGTFGGPASYINPPWELGGPHQMNRYGATVGTAATSIPSFVGCIFCNGLDGQVQNVFHGFMWRHGVVQDLGALPGGDTTSVATSINAGGSVVGHSENGRMDPITGVPEVRAVLWQDGRIKNLGTFGGNHSLVGAINNRGQIVGDALNSIPDQFSWLGLFLGSSNSTQTRAFLWENGHKRDLGTLGGPDAAAGRINERGEVAGISYSDSVANPTTGIPTLEAFLWRKGKMIDLGNFGGTLSGVGEMNNNGQVLGTSSLPGDELFDPFVWDNGRLIDLYTQTVGGNPYTANAINDHGLIVGAGAFPEHPYDAYVWRNGTGKNLGALEGDCFSEAFFINSTGQIVGRSYSCDGTTARPFLWQDERMYDLNELISANSDFRFTEAFVLNDRGEIGGIGTPPGCDFDEDCGHAVVLIPCNPGSDDLECKRNAESGGLSSTATVSPAKKTPLTATENLTGRDLAARLQSRFGRKHVFGLPPLR